LVVAAAAGGTCRDASRSRRLLASLPLERFQMIRDGPRTLTVYVKPEPATPAPAAIARDVRQLLDGAVAVTVVATDGAAFMRRGRDGKHVDFVDVTETDTGKGEK
jgi:hypothetical protein